MRNGLLGMALRVKEAGGIELVGGERQRVLLTVKVDKRHTP